MSRACSFPHVARPFQDRGRGEAPRYAKPKALQPWSCAPGGPQSPAVSTGRSSVRLQQRPRALHATQDMNTAVAAAGLAPLISTFARSSVREAPALDSSSPFSCPVASSLLRSRFDRLHAIRVACNRSR